MARFRDVYLPSSVLSYDTMTVPNWSTGLTRVDSGAEQANARWANPQRKVEIPKAVRSHAQVEELKKHNFIMQGPAYIFPFTDPTDFASQDLVEAGVVGTLTPLDQIIGTGDGFTTDFQLIKTYSLGGYSYVRTIDLPITSSVLIAVNGVEQTTGWAVTREGGVVSFDVAPTNGHVIRAGYLFDLYVRYESDDSFSQVVKSYRASGFADLTLLEVRAC